MYEVVLHVDVCWSTVYEVVLYVDVCWSTVYEVVPHVDVCRSPVYEVVLHVDVCRTGSGSFDRVSLLPLPLCSPRISSFRSLQVTLPPHDLAA